MTAETFVNQDSPTAETAPTADYEPMQRALDPPKEKEKTYSSDVDGLDRAARDLDKSRAQESDSIIERQYVKYENGQPTQERMAPNLTVTAEQAADDLKFQRDQERQEVERISDLATAIQTDAARSGLTPEQIVEQQLAQAQQAPQQPEIQPQPEADLPPETRELMEELNRSPRLKQAPEREAQNIQAVQQGA